MDSYYIMTVLIQNNSTGEWEDFQVENMRCAVFQSMDEPIYSKCSDIQLVNRIPCASPTISQEQCLQMDCCYDSSDALTPCYYGNKVTAECTKDGQLSIVVSRDVTLPPLILSSIKFPGGSGSVCSPMTRNDEFLVFKFPLTDCGTTRKAYGGKVVYENEMVAEKSVQSWSGGAITRDSTFRIHFRCSYTLSGSFPLTVEVFTLPPPPPASSHGPLTLELRIAKDSRFADYYVSGDYPVFKVLREPVFVEVHILHRSDPNLTLVMGQCWATSSANPHQQPQWPLITDGCPYVGDNYKTHLVSIGSVSSDFPSYYKRFIINTFSFIDPASHQALGGLVYVHCTASACVPSSLDSCMSTCHSTKNKRNVPNWEFGNSVTLISAEGFIEFHVDLPEETYAREGIHDGSCPSGLEWIFAAAAILCGILIGMIIFGLWQYLRKEKQYCIKNLKI
ncbi:zona pellucida sperm-binding protein 4-like [Discoglossus pictus]